MYYEEERRRLEFEELKRENEQRDKIRREREEAISSSFGITQRLYNEEVICRREVEAELNRAKTEIEDMKRVQKEMLEMFQTEREMFQKERDEAIRTAEELFRHLNLGTSESSSHSPSSPLQWSVSDEPPQYFRCPISKVRTQTLHVESIFLVQILTWLLLNISTLLF